MNTSLLCRRRGAARYRWLILTASLAMLALFASFLEAVVSRAVPWGQRVDLLVWTSFVTPLPADSSLVLQASAGARDAASGRDRAPGPLAWATGWAAQMRVSLLTDQAAIITQDEQTLIGRLPASLLAGDGRISLTFDSLGDAGAVALRIPGGEQLTLAAGTAIDLAVVPGAVADSWTPLPGNWRPAIEARLAAGEPVGRLTIVNSGLQAAARPRDAHD